MMDYFEKRYIELCSDLGDYSKSGVEKHNNAMKSLSELFSELSKDKALAERLLQKLMKSGHELLELTAAAHSLSLNINISIAEKTLNNLAKRSSDPSTRFSAEMTLSVWKEQGYLEL